MALSVGAWRCILVCFAKWVQFDWSQVFNTREATLYGGVKQLRVIRLVRDSKNKENLKCVVSAKRSGGRMSLFVYLYFFLEAFDIHYVLCFNKGNVDLIVKCKGDSRK
jgi:hypothetical protein